MDVHKPSEIIRDTLAPPGFTQQVGAVLRFVQQQVGGEVIVGLAITNVVLWVLLRPPGVPGTMYLGEIFATTAIVLLSCSLVLATRAQGSTTIDRKSTRLNSSHVRISYAVFCLKKKKPQNT